MRISDIDYDLPPERIAQDPVEPRDAARLMVADPLDGPPTVTTVSCLDELLSPGDLLVLNRTRVFPARLTARTRHGGQREVLLLHPEQAEDPDSPWRVMIGGRVHHHDILDMWDVGSGANLSLRVLALHDDGQRTVKFPSGTKVHEVADRNGSIPLPPYIRRSANAHDKERYQTVFADRPGSVAAPTAGLHLTKELLERLDKRGITTASIDLAIGPGTFKPISEEDISRVELHAEHATCPRETLVAIAACRARGGRVIGVGTTVVRTLESAARAGATPDAPRDWSGWTRLFLHPPQRLTMVDGLLTNFHLPRSSLLLLVSCLTGVPRLLDLYQQAIAANMRFYSYGDAMLLLPSLPGKRP